MADQELLDDVLVALEQNGSPVKNAVLRAVLGWDEGMYETVKAALVARGIVVRGRGSSDNLSLGGREGNCLGGRPVAARRQWPKCKPQRQGRPVPICGTT